MSDEIRLPVDAKPEFIMTGFTKPGGRGVRLYASRSFPGEVFWGNRETYGHIPVWHLDCDLDHMLIIDAASWNEALAQLFQRWANEDAQKENERQIRSAAGVPRPELSS